MRFLKSVLLAGVASAMFLGACPLANAGSIPVTEDDGVGNITLKGTTAGLDVTFANPGTTITQINNGTSTIGLPLPVDMPTFHFVGTASFMTATGTKIITDGTDIVTMDLSLQAEIIGFGASQFILITGTVTSVSESNPGGGNFDWYPIDGAAFSAQNPNAAGGIAALVGHPNLPAKTVAGIFNQSGFVPEPSSVVLMGLGVVALAGVARFRRRNRPC